MSKLPDRQHYISQLLLKQWADENDDVGVVCLYHRYSATMSYKKLHWVHDLSSTEQETAWDRDIENPAAPVLDGLTKSLDSETADFEATRDFLSESSNLDSLVDLARLHYARSLPVPARQLMNSNGMADSAEAEAMIQQRWESTADYHDHGVVITVLPEGSPYILGAVPVFDTQTWGPRDSVDTRFMMPLTPRVMISGVAGLPRGRFDVVAEEIGHNLLLQMPMAGEPGLFPSYWMVCQPSALGQATVAVRDGSEGRSTHWLALRDRLTLCDDASPEQYADWFRRMDNYEQNQAALKTKALRESTEKKIHRTMITEARKLQADLDAFGVVVCGCSRHRRGESSALWRRLMPEVICQAMPSRPPARG